MPPTPEVQRECENEVLRWLTEADIRALGSLRTHSESDDEYCKRAAANVHLACDRDGVTELDLRPGNLQHVDVFITALGGRIIAELLKNPDTKLRKLNLAGNRLGPDGAKAIAEALIINRSLKELDIADNRLGPEGGRALAHSGMFEKNDTLVKLNMMDNKILQPAVRAIAAVLKKNRGLTECYVDSSPGAGGKNALINMLKKNYTLTAIYPSLSQIHGDDSLSENNHDRGHGCEEIAAGLQRNNSFKAKLAHALNQAYHQRCDALEMAQLDRDVMPDQAVSIALVKVQRKRDKGLTPNQAFGAFMNFVFNKLKPHLPDEMRAAVLKNLESESLDGEGLYTIAYDSKFTSVYTKQRVTALKEEFEKLVGKIRKKEKQAGKAVECGHKDVGAEAGHTELSIEEFAPEEMKFLLDCGVVSEEAVVAARRRGKRPCKERSSVEEAEKRKKLQELYVEQDLETEGRHSEPESDIQFDMEQQMLWAAMAESRRSSAGAGGRWGHRPPSPGGAGAAAAAASESYFPVDLEEQQLSAAIADSLETVRWGVRERERSPSPGAGFAASAGRSSGSRFGRDGV